MYRFFVNPEQIEDNTIYILGEDVNHIKNVLRMRVSEKISVSNGIDGKEYDCSIKRIEEERIVCELLFVKEEEAELKAEVTLFQCLPKGDKMELVVQKAVELGVSRIVPVASGRCVVKLDAKRAEAKRNRWQGVAEAAAKQSKRRIVPEVTRVMSFREGTDLAAKLDTALIPYEMWEGMKETRAAMGELGNKKSIGVIIGPEGGFEEEEIKLAEEKGILPISLGRRILRTETAAITILSWIMYQLEE